MMKQFYSAILMVLLFVASTNGDLYDHTEEVPEKYTSKHRSSRYNKPTKSSYIQDEEKSDSYEPDEQESDSYEPDEQESDSDEPDKQESDSYESDESESESYESNEPTSYASKTPSSYVPKKPSTYTPTKPIDDYAPGKSGIEYEFLVPQNAARAAVGLSPLVWDSTLATYAQYWANERKMDCALEHSHGNYGENIFWGSSSDFSASKAASEWIAEQSNYNYGDNSCSGEMCGHYTQIVWKSTTKVGCAKVDCFYGQGVFMVCSYDPAGNVLGEKPY